MKIPKAKAALDKEWGKLEAKNTWRTSTVRLKAAVIVECRRTSKNAISAALWIYVGVSCSGGTASGTNKDSTQSSPNNGNQPFTWPQPR